MRRIARHFKRAIKEPNSLINAVARLARIKKRPKGLLAVKAAGRDKIQRVFSGKTPRKSLSYTEEWRKFARENPRLISDFEKARAKAKAGKTVIAGCIALEQLPKKGSVNYKTYKAVVGGKTFFVKEQRQGMNGTFFDSRVDLAEQQFWALMKAEGIIRNPRFEIAVPHFAWTYGENSFLVTEFYNARHITRAPKPVKMLAVGISEKLAREGIHDAQFLWDPSRQKAIIIDLRAEG